MTGKYDEQIAAGMALLDEKVPEWWQRIDVDRLNTASPCSCVLGQMYGFYGTGLEALGILGFACDYGFGATGAGGGYPSLTRAWRRAIRARRDRPAAARATESRP